MKSKKSKLLLKPKYDVVFQSLFSDKNREETGFFISAILGKKIHIVKVNTEVSQARELPEEKIGRLDLLATTSIGELIHIELQLVDYLNTIPRLLYSSCQLISKQLSRGDRYIRLQKSITIGLLNYELEELSDINKMHTVWHFTEYEMKEKQLTDLQELHIIDMTKAKEMYHKNPQDILAQWILFILDPNETEVQSLMSENEELKRTNEKLENISEDEDVRKKAEILARWEREEKWNRQSVYEHGKEEGKAEILAKWEREEKRNRQSIYEHGKEEEKRKIAKSMREENIPIETISKITGLSQEEIKKLE